jgi:hypothetical protein
MLWRIKTESPGGEKWNVLAKINGMSIYLENLATHRHLNDSTLASILSAIIDHNHISNTRILHARHD